MPSIAATMVDYDPLSATKTREVVTAKHGE
jgi:hypothetical protein